MTPTTLPPLALAVAGPPALPWHMRLARAMRRTRWLPLRLEHHRKLAVMVREALGESCHGCDHVKQWVRAGRSHPLMGVEHSGPCSYEGNVCDYDAADMDAWRRSQLWYQRANGMSARRTR